MPVSALPNGPEPHVDRHPSSTTSSILSPRRRDTSHNISRTPDAILERKLGAHMDEIPAQPLSQHPYVHHSAMPAAVLTVVVSLNADPVVYQIADGADGDGGEHVEI